MRESRTLEYKETVDSNTFMKTVSAFANYGSGKIIFGISDDGKVKGILNPVKACLDLENKINDSIKPVPEYSMEIQEDSTIVLNISEGKYKPYLYKGKAYKRNDSATIEVSRLEYGRLILEGQNQSFEENRSTVQQLTFTTLEEELIRVMGIQRLSKDILKTLELYSDQEGFNNAAALLADENQFKGIDMVRFGSNIDVIMDRETFENQSVLLQLRECIRIFRKYYQYEKIDGVKREVIEKIPEKAFREAIANALIHRTWDVEASIKVSMFEDRVEISSPGGLPAGMSRDEYLNGQISILRNPIIGNVFFRLKYIEKFGTGILRINQAYAAALEKPSYQIFENSIKVVLPILMSGADLSEKERRILDLIRKKGFVTRSEIEKNSGMGKDAVIRILNELLGRNMIIREGKGRGTRYGIFM
ncbi:MAG TPA: putative DNA binding domain-containing protein [Candidatus Lachnoclostridium stercoravium]|uniref:DNA binding domain-containing protein n=1 Tax=Candidatus Lachnoclostridium stercoravium TaxID=2838633 RepID=A0A9D2KMH5_9FIRM|nr:putative DNA binding domain-containing protein [Candidatus Lachnoclostridium stercoravium]